MTQLTEQQWKLGKKVSEKRAKELVDKVKQLSDLNWYPSVHKASSTTDTLYNHRALCDVVLDCGMKYRISISQIFDEDTFKPIENHYLLRVVGGERCQIKLTKRSEFGLSYLIDYYLDQLQLRMINRVKGY